MSTRLLQRIGIRICVLQVAWLSAPGSAATFYLDATGGNDASNGTSPGSAWKTLSKVSSRTFAAGDRIYLKAGESWTGELDLNGDGTEVSPIVVDQYGTGNKPLIDGGGYEAAVRLQGVSCWEVNNLEIVNNGGPTLSGAADYRAGVLVKSAFSAIRRHIYLRNLVIHDIFPETGPYGQGIHVISQGSSSVDTYYDDVRIEDCYVSLTGRFGAWVQHTGTSNEGYKFNRNVVIRNNRFVNTGGSGAETGWCDGVLLESNIVNRSGASVDPRQWARGSGYWPWKCKNVMVQFNEFRHARGEADSCGVHIDYGNRDVTVQYNLSLDNEGGFVEILGDCINSTYRYNVSINDGSRIKGLNGASQDGALIWLSDYVGATTGIGSINSRIFNNTVYVRPGITNYLKIMKGTQDTFIQNNVFFLAGRSVYSDAGTNTVFENNLWHGNLPAGIPLNSAQLANPLVAAPGGTNAADYLLSPVSPAIAMGVVLTNHGAQDYWGNPLPVGAPCLGAHERAFSDSGVISVNFTELATTNQQVDPGKTFGVASQNALVPGWLNLNQTLNASMLPFDNGLPSSVVITGGAPAGWATCNSAYSGTPLLAGLVDYLGTANPTFVTLSNLSATFPAGYKIITYLSGFTSNTGASISDATTTFYYQPLKNPSNEFASVLALTTTTNNPGEGNAPFSQYAVFGVGDPLTNNAVTLTLRARYGGGAILGGVQILSSGPLTTRGVPLSWFATWNIPADDLADADTDGQVAWQEYFAGTNPTNAASVFRVIDARVAGAGVAITWLGGVGGYPGVWSMAVSSNLTTWRVLESGTIPQNPGGTNVWVHTNGFLSGPRLYYRPLMEIPNPDPHGWDSSAGLQSSVKAKLKQPMFDRIKPARPTKTVSPKN